MEVDEIPPDLAGDAVVDETVAAPASARKDDDAIAEDVPEDAALVPPAPAQARVSVQSATSAGGASGSSYAGDEFDRDSVGGTKAAEAVADVVAPVGDAVVSTEPPTDGGAEAQTDDAPAPAQEPAPESTPVAASESIPSDAPVDIPVESPDPESSPSVPSSTDAPADDEQAQAEPRTGDAPAPSDANTTEAQPEEASAVDADPPAAEPDAHTHTHTHEDTVNAASNDVASVDAAAPAVSEPLELPTDVPPVSEAVADAQIMGEAVVPPAAEESAAVDATVSDGVEQDVATAVVSDVDPSAAAAGASEVVAPSVCVTGEEPPAAAEAEAEPEDAPSDAIGEAPPTEDVPAPEIEATVAAASAAPSADAADEQAAALMVPVEVDAQSMQSENYSADSSTGDSQEEGAPSREEGARTETSPHRADNGSVAVSRRDDLGSVPSVHSMGSAVMNALEATATETTHPRDEDTRAATTVNAVQHVPVGAFLCAHVDDIRSAFDALLHARSGGNTDDNVSLDELVVALDRMGVQCGWGVGLGNLLPVGSFERMDRKTGTHLVRWDELVHAIRALPGYTDEEVTAVAVPSEQSLASRSDGGSSGAHYPRAVTMVDEAVQTDFEPVATPAPQVSEKRLAPIQSGVRHAGIGKSSTPASNAATSPRRGADSVGTAGSRGAHTEASSKGARGSRAAAQGREASPRGTSPRDGVTRPHASPRDHAAWILDTPARPTPPRQRTSLSALQAASAVADAVSEVVDGRAEMDGTDAGGLPHTEGLRVPPPPPRRPSIGAAADSRPVLADGDGLFDPTMPSNSMAAPGAYEAMDMRLSSDSISSVPVGPRTLESVLRSYARSLHLLFTHYAFRNRKIPPRATFDDHATKALAVNKGEFLNCCRALGVVGPMMPKDSVLAVYQDMVRIHSVALLDEARFIEAVSRVCIAMLSRPPFSQHFTTDGERVHAVLSLTGISSSKDLTKRLRTDDFGLVQVAGKPSLEATDFCTPEQLQQASITSAAAAIAAEPSHVVPPSPERSGVPGHVSPGLQPVWATSPTPQPAMPMPAILMYSAPGVVAVPMSPTHQHTNGVPGHAFGMLASPPPPTLVPLLSPHNGTMQRTTSLSPPPGVPAPYAGHVLYSPSYSMPSQPPAAAAPIMYAQPHPSAPMQGLPGGMQFYAYPEPTSPGLASSGSGLLAGLPLPAVKGAAASSSPVQPSGARGYAPAPVAAPPSTTLPAVYGAHAVAAPPATTSPPPAARPGPLAQAGSRVVAAPTAASPAAPYSASSSYTVKHAKKVR